MIPDIPAIAGEVLIPGFYDAAGVLKILFPIEAARPTERHLQDLCREGAVTGHRIGARLYFNPRTVFAELSRFGSGHAQRPSRVAADLEWARQHQRPVPVPAVRAGGEPNSAPATP